MRVRAKRRNYYNGKEFAPGEEYDMDDREAVAADVLHRIGIIEILSGKSATVTKAAPPPAAPQVVQSTTQFPDAAIVPKAESGEAPARQRYYRKREESP